MNETIAPVAKTADRVVKRRVPLVIVACLIVVGIVGIMALFGSLVSPKAPGAQDLALGLSKPSHDHWLGTDVLGRDVLSRVIAGARTAVVGPLVIALGSMLIGNLLGLVAGYFGGIVDAIIMRWVDLMWSIPALLVIIVVAGAVGGGYWLAVGLLTLLSTPVDARVVRGATLEQTPRPYVEAAKVSGVSTWRILLFHIWPNVSPVAVANAFLIFAASLVALSGLSFLGLGVHPGTPDWGLMLAEGRPLLLANPVATLTPGVMVVVTAACMNVLGDWVYEELSSRGAGR